MNVSRQRWLKRAALGLGLVMAAALAGCISVGGAGAAPTHYLLHDTATGVTRRAQALVPALLIQSVPGDASADTASIAYSRRADEFAFYQLATWTERPVRQLPRLLARRIEARGVAGAVGLLGDPLASDWLLAVAIDSLYHDVAAPPGVARFALSAELFDRRSRTRVARRQFTVELPTARADSAAAAAALSAALTLGFDALLPWLEDALQAAVAARP